MRPKVSPDYLGTTRAAHAARDSGSSARKSGEPTLPERWGVGGLRASVGREAGCGRGREVRKAARFARPSTSGLTPSMHPFGTTLVPRIVPNITLGSGVQVNAVQRLWPALPPAATCSLTPLS